MIIAMIPAPSSFQMMDVHTPHPGSPRPGELGPAYHSIMYWPFCTGAWAQPSPEWAVFPLQLSIWAPSSAWNALPLFFLWLYPPLRPHHPLRVHLRWNLLQEAFPDCFPSHTFSCPHLHFWTPIAPSEYLWLSHLGARVTSLSRQEALWGQELYFCIFFKSLLL